MAGNSTGKWVARAASTGGGRTYRGQMPVNWYATLVIIVVVGLFLVGFSRYQLTHKTSSSAGQPTTSTTWYAALGIDVCGTLQPDLPASTNTSATGLTANGNGVLTISPKNATESGANATLGRFVSHYKGLTLTPNSLRYPGKQLWTDGETCPKGTPDAGKQGYVTVVNWENYESKKGSEVGGDPRNLAFANNGQMITMAFLPATATVPKPPGTAVSALITAVTSGPTTATTAPTTTPTTAPTTATTAPTATTTPTATTSGTSK